MQKALNRNFRESQSPASICSELKICAVPVQTAGLVAVSIDDGTRCIISNYDGPEDQEVQGVAARIYKPKKLDRQINLC